MKFFYDTEFIEDGETIDLVSIGIVAEDGREFYAVSSEFDMAALCRNPWLVENVFPSLPVNRHPAGRGFTQCRCMHGHLDRDHPDVRSRAQIARAVRDFLLGTDPEQLQHVELWADHAASDFVALCQLYGTMMDLPEGMPMWTHDVQQAIETAGLSSKDAPLQTDGLHNALADARHARDLARWAGVL